MKIVIEEEQQTLKLEIAHEEVQKYLINLFTGKVINWSYICGKHWVENIAVCVKQIYDDREIVPLSLRADEIITAIIKNRFAAITKAEIVVKIEYIQLHPEKEDSSAVAVATMHLVKEP